MWSWDATAARVKARLAYEANAYSAVNQDSNRWQNYIWKWNAPKKVEIFLLVSPPQQNLNLRKSLEKRVRTAKSMLSL